MQFSLDIRFNNTWKKFIAVERIKFQVYVIHFVSHSTRKFVMINFFILNSTRTFRRRQHVATWYCRQVCSKNKFNNLHTFCHRPYVLKSKVYQYFHIIGSSNGTKEPPSFSLKKSLINLYSFSYHTILQISFLSSFFLFLLLFTKQSNFPPQNLILLLLKCKSISSLSKFVCVEDTFAEDYVGEYFLLDPWMCVYV